MIVYYDKETKHPFYSKDDVDWNILPVAKEAAFYVSLKLNDLTGTQAVVTNGRRSLESQLNAMKNLKAKFGEEYYRSVYKPGTDPARMPHVEGRAVDFRYYPEAVDGMKELNGKYLDGIVNAIGFRPSSLVVIETNNCFHVQVPRLEIDSVGRYVDFIKSLV